MAESMLEKKVIFFYDSRGLYHHLIAFRTQYIEGSIDPLTRLLKETGFRAEHTWLLRVIIPPSTRPKEIVFSFRWDYWPSVGSEEIGYYEFYPDFRELHFRLERYWDTFKSGQIVRASELYTPAPVPAYQVSEPKTEKQIPPF